MQPRRLLPRKRGSLRSFVSFAGVSSASLGRGTPRSSHGRATPALRRRRTWPPLARGPPPRCSVPQRGDPRPAAPRPRYSRAERWRASRGAFFGLRLPAKWFFLGLYSKTLRSTYSPRYVVSDRHSHEKTFCLALRRCSCILADAITPTMSVLALLTPFGCDLPPHMRLPLMPTASLQISYSSLGLPLTTLTAYVSGGAPFGLAARFDASEGYAQMTSTIQNKTALLPSGYALGRRAARGCTPLTPAKKSRTAGGLRPPQICLSE